MIDTHGRRIINSSVGKVSNCFIKNDISPNQVTLAALVIGLVAAIVLGFSMPVLSILLLWLSGLMDVVDGDLARKLNQSSKMGTLLDIVGDRIVEISIILVLGFKNAESQFVLMLLLSAIILSMTVFLTLGALVENKEKKGFHYQTGLAERTEGFIFLTLMMLFPSKTTIIALIFALVVFITAVQRMVEGIKLLK